jgi:hypothetical protein
MLPSALLEANLSKENTARASLREAAKEQP